MNKFLVPSVFLFFIMMLESGCQKVIKLDLNSADPHIIIEGNISDQPGPYIVKITKTINYDQSNVFPGVHNAIVKISDNAGNVELLSETSSGIYSTSTLTGTAGRTYTMTVLVDGKEFKATSYMNYPVAIDTMTVLKPRRGGQNNEDNGSLVFPNFYDPAGIENYYRFTPVCNGVQDKTIYLDFDLLRDGQYIESGPVGYGDVKYMTGDSVTVYLQVIDKDVLNYFNTLSDAQGGGFGAAPANPTTNISNGALGYFSAYSVTSKQIVIP